MTLLACNNSMQQCSAAILSCASIHFLLLLQRLFEGRRRIAAQAGLAKTWTDEIHDNSSLRYGELGC